MLGDCFLRRKSSFLLWFLLIVEGLVLFLATGVAGVSFSWVAREKEKEEPMEMEKVKDLPWVSSAWQNSRHLEAKVWSPPITTSAVIFVVISESEILVELWIIAHGSSRLFSATSDLLNMFL